MIRHKESHLDHGLSEAQVEYLLTLSVSEATVVVKTIELPPELGTVPCGLHGPLVGDEPVPEAEVTYAVRGERKGPSRLVAREPRQTRLVTVVAGSYDGFTDVLFTAFGGPQAPREPFEDDGEEAKSFWAQHALSAEGSGA